MAYSFIATTTKCPDWKRLNSNLFKSSSAVEMFPIASTETDKYYLGLSIPTYKLNQNNDTWSDLVETINKLKADYEFEVFDLYNGFVVTPDNLDQVKKALIPE